MEKNPTKKKDDFSKKVENYLQIENYANTNVSLLSSKSEQKNCWYMYFALNVYGVLFDLKNLASFSIKVETIHRKA